MKALLSLFVVFSLPLNGVETVDPKDPKLFREQKERVDTTLKKFKIIENKSAERLYRSWVNPVKTVRNPKNQLQTSNIVRPEVRQPVLNQSFSKMNEWNSGRVIHLFGKSKEFDKVLNPLSLRDFNRFIYQRNPSSP